MSNKQFQCPVNDLEDLVRGINEIIFPIIVTAPDKEKIRSYVRKMGEILEEDETERVYRERRKIYDETQSVRENFDRYFGIKTSELRVEDLEDVRNKIYGILRRHVSTHGECLDKYFKFLNAEADKNSEHFAALGKEYDPEIRLKSLDGMYLNLMDVEE
jgi:hypothetical protein